MVLNDCIKINRLRIYRTRSRKYPEQTSVYVTDEKNHILETGTKLGRYVEGARGLFALEGAESTEFFDAGSIVNVYNCAESSERVYIHPQEVIRSVTVSLGEYLTFKAEFDARRARYDALLSQEMKHREAAAADVRTHVDIKMPSLEDIIFGK